MNGDSNLKTIATFLLLCLLLLLFLLLLGVALNLLLERQLNLDLIVFLEVGRDGHLEDGWIVLQVKEQLVQVHVD